MTIQFDDARAAPHPGDAASLPVSFAAFFRANYASTVRLAHLLSGSDAAAEELAQDSFERVYPHYERLREPKSYLRVATVNVCRNWHRSRLREEHHLRRHGAADTVAILESDEITDAILKLPYRQRAVLVLRYWLDSSEADIAQAIGCRPGTVKSLHSRALASMRGVLR